MKKRRRKIPSKTKISEKKRKQTLTHWFQPIATTEDENNLRKNNNCGPRIQKQKNQLLGGGKLCFVFLAGLQLSPPSLTHSKKNPTKEEVNFPLLQELTKSL